MFWTLRVSFSLGGVCENLAALDEVLGMGKRRARLWLARLAEELLMRRGRLLKSLATSIAFVSDLNDPRMFLSLNVFHGHELDSSTIEVQAPVTLNTHNHMLRAAFR